MKETERLKEERGKEGSAYVGFSRLKEGKRGMRER